jgi:general secretion pathway protein K
MNKHKSAAGRARRRRKEAGIALIMVMGAVALLTVMLAEFQDDTSAEAASAMADRDGVQAEYMARSAVNLARLLIATEPTIRQAIAPLFAFLKRTPPQLPVWEFSDQLLGAFNDKESANSFGRTLGLDLSLGKNLGMPGGRWELVIVDEDSKIDANLGASNDIAHIRLAKELMGLMAPLQYNPMFEQRDSRGQFHDRLQTCQALIDWADVDELAFSCDFSSQNAPASSGVEDAYYALQPKSYRRKNAPYDSLEELHMVNGITEDFWATFIDPDPPNPKKRVVTVWGQGAINVNTANAQTLLGVVCAGAPQAEICTDPAQASLFLMGVTMARGITMGAPLFGAPQDFLQTMKGQGALGPLLAMLGMKPVKFLSESEFTKSITTESKMFSIYAVGVVKGYKRETRTSVHAVLDYRTAPVLSAAPVASGSSSTAAPPPPPPPPSAATNGSGPMTAATQANAGGNIVYFHIE